MAENDQPGDKGYTGSDADSDGLVRSRADGQLHFTSASAGTIFPIDSPTEVTPLEQDEPEGIIPPSPLWAMKERRHEQLHLFGHPARIRVCVGTGDAAVYAIDDGKHHCMIGHRVGATLDGCVYSLVGRVTKDTYEALAAGSIDGKQAFFAAHEIGLSGTAEAPGVSNVFDVDYYDSGDDIPAEYLPGSPYLEFARDLPTADR